MSKNKLSVVIPFYQRECGLLRRAIDSLLEQSFSGIEIPEMDQGKQVFTERPTNWLVGLKILGSHRAS